MENIIKININKKILSVILIIIIIYISKFEQFTTKIIQKKQAIKYIKNIIQNSLINNIFKEHINEHPHISIVIPLYNCQNTIQTSIVSIHMQKFTNYEIILINDHSSDNTSKIVNKIKFQDNRIKYIL